MPHAVLSQAALQVGRAAQLFADDRLIASRSAGLTRTMHSPQPSFRTALAPDAPWPGLLGARKGFGVCTGEVVYYFTKRGGGSRILV